MSRHDAAPTHTWIITSHINKFVVRVSLLLCACILVATMTLIARLNSNCRDVARYDLRAFGYEAHVAFNVTSERCNS